MNEAQLTQVVRALLCSTAFAALAVTAAACGDDDGTGSSESASGAAGTHADAGVEPTQPQGCGDDADAGSCDMGENCIAGRCVVNTCGDGVVAGPEVCDDGNVTLGDGCDPGCRRELASCGDGERQDPEECDDGNLFDFDDCSIDCAENVCGNARIDALEECDDGDLIDDNECSNACTENRCRNGRVDPGEECDDGNRTHDDGPSNADTCTNGCQIVICGNGRTEGKEECDDANEDNEDECTTACTANACGNMRIDVGEMCDGDTLDGDCKDDCSGFEENNACADCEAQHCTNYLDIPGFDVVSGCLSIEAVGQAARTLFGADVRSDEMTFVQQCIDLVNCGRQSECAFANEIATVGPALPCYCGTRPQTECQEHGPGDDAPCVEEWLTATRAATNAEVFARVADPTFPSGWAYNLLECDNTPASPTGGGCREQCAP